MTRLLSITAIFSMAAVLSPVLALGTPAFTRTPATASNDPDAAITFACEAACHDASFPTTAFLLPAADLAPLFPDLQSSKSLTIEVTVVQSTSAEDAASSTRQDSLICKLSRCTTRLACTLASGAPLSSATTITLMASGGARRLQTTVSPSISRTPSISVSSSKTPTISVSKSKTPTISRTPSISVSASRTPTISVSPSKPVAGASVSPSISRTPTISRTPSISVSASRTPTISVSPSKPVAGASVSPSISRTPTISVSASKTPTISVSPSKPVAGASVSPSISRTPTISVSASKTPTISVSPAAGASVSPSISRTPSISAFASNTPTISVSPAAGASVSPSISHTPTISLSPAAGASVSPSTSTTAVPSSSASGSATDSSSFGASNSPSVSKTARAEPSGDAAGALGAITASGASGLGSGPIAGIVMAATVVLGLVAAAVFVAMRRRKSSSASHKAAKQDTAAPAASSAVNPASPVQSPNAMTANPLAATPQPPSGTAPSGYVSPNFPQVAPQAGSRASGKIDLVTSQPIVRASAQPTPAVQSTAAPPPVMMRAWNSSTAQSNQPGVAAPVALAAQQTSDVIDVAPLGQDEVVPIRRSKKHKHRSPRHRSKGRATSESHGSFGEEALQASEGEQDEKTPLKPQRSPKRAHKHKSRRAPSVETSRSPREDAPTVVQQALLSEHGQLEDKLKQRLASHDSDASLVAHLINERDKFRIMRMAEQEAKLAEAQEAMRVQREVMQQQLSGRLSPRSDNMISYQIPASSRPGSPRATVHAMLVNTQPAQPNGYAPRPSTMQLSPRVAAAAQLPVIDEAASLRRMLSPRVMTGEPAPRGRSQSPRLAPPSMTPPPAEYPGVLATADAGVPGMKWALIQDPDNSADPWSMLPMGVNQAVPAYFQPRPGVAAQYTRAQQRGRSTSPSSARPLLATLQYSPARRAMSPRPTSPRAIGISPRAASPRAIGISPRAASPRAIGISPRAASPRPTGRDPRAMDRVMPNWMKSLMLPSGTEQGRLARQDSKIYF